MFSNSLKKHLLLQNIGIVQMFSRNKGKKKEELEKEQEFKNSLLCRFVLDGTGKKVGESVGIDNDIVIIKTKNRYLGVPLKHIEDEGKTLLVKGLVDDYNAEIMGEKWRKESFKEIKYDKEKDGF
jgi:hypothetical protein